MQNGKSWRFLISRSVSTRKCQLSHGGKIAKEKIGSSSLNAGRPQKLKNQQLLFGNGSFAIQIWKIPTPLGKKIIAQLPPLLARARRARQSASRTTMCRGCCGRYCFWSWPGDLGWHELYWCSKKGSLPSVMIIIIIIIIIMMIIIIIIIIIIILIIIQIMIILIMWYIIKDNHYYHNNNNDDNDDNNTHHHHHQQPDSDLQLRRYANHPPLLQQLWRQPLCVARGSGSNGLFRWFFTV